MPAPKDLWTDAGDKVIVSGYQDGYSRLGGKIVHRRTIEVSLNEAKFEISDEISGGSTSEHLFKCAYLTPFACQIGKDDSSATITASGEQQLDLKFESTSQLRLKTEPAAFFPRYGVTQWGTRLICSSRSVFPFNMTTSFKYEDEVYWQFHQLYSHQSRLLRPVLKENQ
jgi:hypothetical protein